MSDRVLVHETEEDDDLGVTWHLVVSRSAAGRPGGFVEVARVDQANDEETLVIQLPDLAVLAPAIEWARGAPPPPTT